MFQRAYYQKPQKTKKAITSVDRIEGRLEKAASGPFGYAENQHFMTRVLESEQSRRPESASGQDFSDQSKPPGQQACRAPQRRAFAEDLPLRANR